MLRRWPPEPLPEPELLWPLPEPVPVELEPGFQLGFGQPLELLEPLPEPLPEPLELPEPEPLFQSGRV